MATIRASCPTCGDVEITSHDMTVQVCATNNQGSYAFRCPSCHVAVSKLADQRIIDLLVSSGVAMSVWSMPAELNETKLGPAFTYDDLLELHYQLQQESWFERLISPISRGEDS